MTNDLLYQQQVRKGDDLDNMNKEMTLQEAAHFLKVPYVSFMKLIEQEKIPYHEIDSCRRINVKDLVAYKKQRDEQRRQGIREFTAFLEDEGFYSEDYSSL
ncbi:MAG: helix-turn-helix domain-containing protein [Microcystaceae cyanobacterium]